MIESSPLGIDLLPPALPEAVVPLRKSFPLFPPERTRIEIIGTPDDEQHEVSLSSIVINDTESGYRFTLTIAGSYNIDTPETEVKGKESEIEETGPDMIETKTEPREQGLLGIEAKTSTLNDNMLARDGEDQVTTQLTRAAIVFLDRLRIVTIRNGREKRIKPEINDNHTGAFFRLRNPLEEVTRDEVGKIKGKVILIGRHR